MKIIHCADVHLGSKIERLPKLKAEERKAELRASFSRMVEFAKTNGVAVILLSGDVFDSDRPLKKDKRFFYDVVKANPEIDFLYLRGNHDSRESYSEYGIENLKTFSDEWTAYNYDEVAISGIEIAPENAVSMYSTLKLDPSKLNIVMLHGQIGDVSGKDKINLNKLRNKNVDYLALGHIHSFKEGKLDDRGRFAYCGCLEGRGFDEAGKKGFVLLDIGSRIESRFVPFARREVAEFTVDISEVRNAYEAYVKVKSEVNSARQNIIRINLVGETGFDDEFLASEVEEHLSTDYYFVSVKDRTERKAASYDYSGDLSLKGEFIRCVLANDDLSEADKREVIAIGLKALAGKEVQ